MKSEKFECDDRYEAEKLSSLLSIQKDGAVWFTGVAAVVNTDIIIRLKDKSCHAVALKDEENVKKLVSLLEAIANGNIHIHSSNFSGSLAEIVVLEGGE